MEGSIPPLKPTQHKQTPDVIPKVHLLDEGADLTIEM